MTTSSRVTGKELPVQSISRRGRVRPRRDFAALEQRRMRAVDLFEQGVIPAEIARQIGVSHQIVSAWRTLWRQSGRDALRAAGRAGRRPKLTSEQLAEVEVVLAKGAEANGYPTDLWTLPRVAEVIERLSGVAYHPGMCGTSCAISWSGPGSGQLGGPSNGMLQPSSAGSSSVGRR